MDLFDFFKPMLMQMEPEAAHRRVLRLMRTGFMPRSSFQHEGLKTEVLGFAFDNPLGLAAGFDKDAEVLKPLFRMGFGFVEAGTVTPLPQEGNPAPRVFRDIKNQSVINRMGFPGKGLDYFKEKASAFKRKHPDTILGVNIGINKDTQSPVGDYLKGMEALYAIGDYLTVNISSPNTQGLRNLQAKEELAKLLAALMAKREELQSDIPVLVKVAPDLDNEQKADIAETVVAHKVDGLIVSNTTISRPFALQSDLKEEKGGLSGRLLTPIATPVIRDFYRLTQGNVPIIGVGGISSAQDAYDKIRAGACLLQVYTALIYQGPALIDKILKGLVALLQRDGFSCVAEAVGADVREEESMNGKICAEKAG